MTRLWPVPWAIGYALFAYAFASPYGDGWWFPAGFAFGAAAFVALAAWDAPWQWRKYLAILTIAPPMVRASFLYLDPPATLATLPWQARIPAATAYLLLAFSVAFIVILSEGTRRARR